MKYQNKDWFVDKVSFPKKNKKDIVKRLVERAKNYTPKKPEQKSVEYQLGFMIGEYIVLKYLPTLSDGGWQSRNTIQISDEEQIEYKRLEKLWHNKYNRGRNDAKQEWFDLKTYEFMLEEKYLPHILKCYVYPINVENIIDLKQGIRDSLWDCDMCNYKIETDDDIIIESEEFFENFSVVKLKLDMDKKIVF